MTIDYQVEINKLKAGEIEKLVVERDDFFEFREVWLKDSNRDAIIGEASLGGSVIYTYQQSVE
ncbi:hypothetical protein G7081_00280 [Vagococcus coleopterorum]|uniref:Uncharacterized protein n=1 Tax=Vagococcus coleopterorum TaxID=2714946 RepID=A0A6G8AKN5_9ENTE|nr:hypothetical protein [Vagococcus coleopterorum]QIL45631.1 hypothetical protein G7081_00280 [Vagococcus coleopterorum]